MTLTFDPRSILTFYVHPLIFQIFIISFIIIIHDRKHIPVGYSLTASVDCLSVYLSVITITDEWRTNHPIFTKFGTDLALGCGKTSIEIESAKFIHLFVSLSIH